MHCKEYFLLQMTEMYQHLFSMKNMSWYLQGVLKYQNKLHTHVVLYDK